MPRFKHQSQESQRQFVRKKETLKDSEISSSDLMHKEESR